MTHCSLSSSDISTRPKYLLLQHRAVPRLYLCINDKAIKRFRKWSQNSEPMVYGVRMYGARRTNSRATRIRVGTLVPRPSRRESSPSEPPRIIAVAYVPARRVAIVDGASGTPQHRARTRGRAGNVKYPFSWLRLTGPKSGLPESYLVSEPQNSSLYLSSLAACRGLFHRRGLRSSLALLPLPESRVHTQGGA